MLQEKEREGEKEIRSVFENERKRKRN